MQTSHNGRTFEKPYRTWGGSALNFIGRQLRSCGWQRPLTFQGVLDSACRFTRLSDWGDERFHEPLRVLVQSLEEEAELTPLGRLLMKGNLRHFAANRLWVRQYVKDHPEALEEPLPRPLFVVGLPRTGTTLLYNLLCQDESRRPLRLWETLQPAPSSRGRRSDWRRTKARLIVHAMQRWGVPQLRSVHAFDADGPEECTGLMLNTFVSPAFFLLGRIPGYLAWLRRRGRKLLPWAYEQYRSYLQVLQHQGRRAPWLLKSPAHSFGLQALLAALPDACVVLTQRDLQQVVPSTCSLSAIVKGMYSDRVDCRRLGPEILALIGDLQQGIQQAADLKRKCLFFIDYQSLLSDPIGTVRAIYQHFDLPLENAMEQRMRGWLARNPPNKHGVHKYDLEQFGLSEQTEVWRAAGLVPAG
ncbi:MAG TPA: sulfotransferase [Gemmataceae bacterium]|nr:sulfotransferase [Gemmataceae bacterium]